MKPLAACLLALSFAALALAACGGGGGSSGSTGVAPDGGERPAGSADAPDGRPDAEAGGPSKATAPRAPAGSKVVSCAAGGAAFSELRAAATDCDAARAAMRRWRRSPGCGLGPGASRGSCSPGPYRCQAISVDRGTAVSCARRGGGDVSFLVRRGP